MNRQSEIDQPQVSFPYQLTQKYFVEKLVGQGAYGKVWKGVEKKTGKNVAIKGFFHLFKDCIDAKRVLREISILGQIEHHNHIVKLLDIIRPDDLVAFEELFIVLEWAQSDLRSQLRGLQENFMPMTLIKRIMYEILLGLAACKRYGLIHRDIKPANILIVNDERIKVCDFGLARELNSLKVRHGTETKRKFYDDIDKSATCEEFSFSKKQVKQSKESKSKTSRPNIQVMEMASKKQTLKKQLPFSKASAGQKDKPKATIVNVGKNTLALAIKVDTSNSENQDEQSEADSISKTIELMNNTITPDYRKANKFTFEKLPLKRSLTRHIVTRWYRPPEVILVQDYDYKVDIWSAGCIFAELLGLTYASSIRGILFPGRSCYPMSPYREKKYEKKGMIIEKETISLESYDQMNLILNALGTPEEKDLEFIKQQDRKKYVQNFTKTRRWDFNKIYPEASPEAIDLLLKMLEFNPKNRINVEDCLKHPFFDRIGFQEEIPNDIEPIHLDFDHDHLHLCAFDLRALILREVNKFNPIPNFEETFGFILKEIKSIAKNGSVDYS